MPSYKGCEMSEQSQTSVKPFIFFSIDIVDSAFYKSRFINEWIKDFECFLEAFPKKIDEMRQNLTVPRHKPLTLPCPDIWKFVGDEILFFIDINESYAKLADKQSLTYYELVLYYMFLFRKAILCYNRSAYDNLMKNRRALTIKGAAWFADVIEGPNYDESYGNIEVKSANKKSSGAQTRDFIGRQIDIGFRIARHSTLNRFIVSIEFAILLLRDNYLTIEDAGIKLFYEGRKPIKGILESVDYPIIYIDMEDRLEHSEANLLRHYETPVNPVSLMRFMEEYIKRSNRILYYPFINEKDTMFSERPF